MPEVVGIRFKRGGKVYYFDPAGLDLKVNDYVIVETTRGTEAGRVVIAPTQVLESEIVEPIKPILRRADVNDLHSMELYKSQEQEAFRKAQEKIAQHALPMKLVTAEYSFDGSRLTFYFTAEGRVDFRGLVRELASIFRTRIELRQIGVRDEVKLRGGLGRCGRPLCCASFMGEFASVTIKMAKDQDLPLNPMKISGICGRLLCCLAYENETYCALKEGMPRLGEGVNTPLGQGMVIGLNVLKETVMVELGSKATVEVPAAEIKRLEEQGLTIKPVGRKRRR